MIVAVAEFRQDRLCVQDTLVDNTGYGGNFLDANRDLMFNYFYDNGLIPDLLSKIHLYRKIGKDVTCLIKELSSYNALIELFVFILEDQVCFGLDGFDELLEEYKFCCIREYLKCQYGTGNVVDELVDMLRIRFGATGIGFMTISDPMCTPFKIN